MKSMTGFGSSELMNEEVHATVDLKSYNHRYLDISVNLPPFLNQLEPAIRDFLSARVGRGRVECYLRYRELKEDLTISLDSDVAAKYAEILSASSKMLGVDGSVGISDFIKLDGVLKTDKALDIDKTTATVIPVLEKAFDTFEQSRVREGKHTEKDILDHVVALEDAVTVFSTHADVIELDIKENLTKRFQEVLGDAADEQRVLAETAVLLVRFSINEEITRLESHLSDFRVTVSKGGQIGKKLDFLCQELNREFNTVGSKSQNLDVTRGVVAAKDALENIREQLRNVE